MSLINVRERTIQAKIVYYGTALSGKTTSLKHVHRVIDPDGRVELVSLNTEGDRTFFFDFLPIPLGTVHGYQLRFQAFTVPGQVKYNLTRRYVLRGADAVIFVADSSPAAWDDNIHSLKTLRENLAANGLDPKTTPVIVQYNKRDAEGAISVERLRAELNPEGHPDWETIAVAGVGAFEAFAHICAVTVEKLAREYRVGDPADARSSVERRLLTTLLAHRRVVEQRARGDDDAASATGTVTSLATAVDAGARPAVVEVSSASLPDMPDAEHLLQHAVETNIASAKLVSELTETRARLEDHVRQLAALHQTGVALSSELDPDRLLDEVLSAGLRTVDTSYGSILLLDDSGTALRRKLLHGFARDPIEDSAGTDADFLTQLAQRKPFAVDVDAEVDADGNLGAPSKASPIELMDPSKSRDACALSALVAPLVHQGEVLGAIVAYVLDRPVDQDLRTRLRFLGAVASQAAVALVNSRLYARVESFNRELEQKVAERTRDLARALDDLRELDRLKDDFLASMSHELLTPLQSIASSAEILQSVAAEEGPRAADERREFAGVVARETERLTTLLQNVLDMSELETGRVTPERTPVVLRDVVLTSYQRQRPAFKAAGSRLKIRVEEGMGAALGDAAWVGRAVDALLGNAVKFAPHGSDVVVTIRADGPKVRLEVRDAGPGVPPTLRASIFQKFKQAGDILTDKPAGLGLGLPMARAILERMGGTIECESVPEGGSAFVVTLPAASQPVRL